ncbi:hypothetical protein DSO57_1009615 [Entomophthora muscae]|uniref:Uncharacterized protein n=1 Tax=Entomophthora muscae TaxID=34485 RepID=A0ACC2SJP4_9FUNG|nr:hypothetical protein DSO57_1009615 [Entomophthora muscae]
MPTQEGDRRGEFHSDAALTQLVQGAQAARAQIINPWVPKLTRKPTKVTTTKMVRNKEVELTSYVFDIVYRQEPVPSAMLEKMKPVIDTSYKPYISDGNQEENKEPKFYQTNEGQLVLKKVVVFYNKVPMPCKPVTNQNPGLSEPTKPAQKSIPDINHIILLKLMCESDDYKVAAAIVGVDPKYPSKTSHKFINTGRVLATEKSLRVSTMLTKEHKWAIHQWITRDHYLELANIQAMVKSTFGIEDLIFFYYHLVKGIQYPWKKLGVSPYNRNSPANLETRKKYAEAYTALKAKGTVKFYYIDKSAFALSMRNEYGYVPKGLNVGMAQRAAVCATAYSMVALLSPKGCQNRRLDLPTRFQPSRFVTCNPITRSPKARLGSQLKLTNLST